MSSFDPEQITFFAKTDARGQQVPFGIKAKDRTKHVYVIGKTGMGKSTLLENMAVQDMKNGNGIAFIDPHGATAEVLLEYIPEDRVKDVLYFAPFDTANPISFNVMEDVGPDKRHLVVSGLMSVFKKIWVDAWSARMEYILSNTLLALLEYPDSTLLGVNRMLSDKHYRKKVVENIKDPAVKSFWVDEFANYNERYMQEAGDAIKNKIGQFTSNPLIRNIVGQPHSSFDLREVMDGKKILIANLSKGLVGESNANLLGSMLTTRLYLAAMSRADLSAEQLKQMPNFYFYVDEFQSFANATFADILSEARKYKLNLTIAHQYIEQMEEEVRNAVFGNVGTIIAFRVGPFDAEVLETVFTPKFLAADIVNLGFAQIYLSLMIDGIGSQPFSAVTLPPIVPPHVSYKEMAIAESRRQFAGSREQVEEAINAWHAEVHADIKSPREREPSSAPVSGSVVPKAPASSVRPAGASTRAVQSGEKVPLRAREAVRTSVAAAATHREVAVPVPRAEVSVAEALVLERVVLREEAVPVVAMVRPVAHAPRKLQSMARMPSSATVVGEAGQRVRRATKDLSELRSVLKNIASGDKKEVKTENAVPGAAHDAAAQAKDDTREALKSALAAVVGATVLQSASHADVSVPAKPSSVVTDAVLSETERQLRAALAPAPVQSPEAPAVAPAPTVTLQAPAVTHVEPLAPIPTPAPMSSNPYAEAKNRNPLDPKRLERMMRVTGNDRNPLR